MRKIMISILFMMMFVITPGFIYSQQKIFTRMDIPLDGILGITQDRQGYVWFIARNNGLYRYDGSQFVSFVHDEKDSNSITGAPLECIAVDSNTIMFGSAALTADWINSTLLPTSLRTSDTGPQMREAWLMIP